MPLSHDATPGIIKHELTPSKPLKLRQVGGALEGPAIKLDASKINTDLSSPFRLDPGQVVVESTSAGLYIRPGQKEGDPASGTAPAITSAETPDSDWDAKTFKLWINGVKVAEVTLSGSQSIAQAVTDLNGDSDFADHATAADSGGDDLLVVTAHQKGGDVSMRAQVDLTTAYATAVDTNDDGSNNASEDTATGDDADFRVLKLGAELKDEKHADQDAIVANYLRAVFDESELTDLTDEAKAALRRRGAIFL